MEQKRKKRWASQKKMGLANILIVVMRWKVARKGCRAARRVGRYEEQLAGEKDGKCMMVEPVGSRGGCGEC